MPGQLRPDHAKSNWPEHWHIAATMPKLTGHSRLEGSLQQHGKLSQDAFELLSDVILTANGVPKNPDALVGDISFPFPHCGERRI